MSYFEQLGEEWSAQQAQVASVQTEVGKTMSAVEAADARLDKLERQMSTMIESLQAVHAALAPMYKSLADAQLQNAANLASQAAAKAVHRSSKQPNPQIPSKRRVNFAVVVPQSSDEEYDSE